MKRFIILVLLLILSACSTIRNERAIDDEALDALAAESYFRWGDKRLSTANVEKDLVISCYQGKIEETLEEYKKNYSQKDKNQYYWLHIGNCYFLKEEFKKSEFFYRLALDDTKEKNLQALAHNNLALVQLKFKRWTNAKRNLKKAIALNENLKVPQFNLAQLYLQFGYFEPAIKILKGPLFNGQQDLDVNFSLAMAHLFIGDLKEAENYFNLIPKDHFTREDIAITYSLFLIQKGELKKAKKIIRNRDISSVTEISDISKKVEGLLDRRLRE